MDAIYIWLKFVHILLAVVALGASAGLGILLEFYGGDGTHGAFLLRAIERLLAWVVLPGYVLLLATGVWMASLAASFAAGWIRMALSLWVIGLACLVGSLAALKRQERLQGTGGVIHARHAMASRVTGAAFGLVVVAILYLMVLKP